ncbi:MAG: tRNA (uridine(54)-C5)-methyltransferase TrmA [Pseudomonadota bacterium]
MAGQAPRAPGLMPLSAFQPADYEALFQQKVERVCGLFNDDQPPTPALYTSPPEAFRMRAEFRMWHDGDALDYVMFQPGDPRTPVPISHFPIACAAIQALMPPLQEHLRGNPILRRKLFQVEFLSTLAGDTLITLIYHRQLDEGWEREARNLAATLNVALVGRSRKQKVVLSRDYVTEALPVRGQTYHYRQYEQAFTQPNAYINSHMLAWACERAEALTGDLLELYCGNGNFTLPLASCFDQVIATELSKVSTRAALHNLADNGIDNAQVIRLSAEEVAQAMAGTRAFRRLAKLPKPLADYKLKTVFVDPPRAGLDEATLKMVSAFPNILYISCNPETLSANLAALRASHRIVDFALFDQFPYTAHMECGVLLQQRMP